jgi:site-specific DNA recombinase
VEYAEAKGWVVVECIKDTASGSNLDRPGIERVRQLLSQGFVDVVLAYAMDRLSRNQIHIAVLLDDIEKVGANLEFVTEDFENTPVGRLILNVRAFAGEVEREKIAERTMRGKLERARAGKLPQGTGKGCYGYIYDRGTGKRTVMPEQSTVVRRIFDEFLSGTSIVRIANRLNDEGYTTFTGSKWHPATIYHMLRNDTYAGRSIFGRTTSIKVRGTQNGRARRSRRTRDSSEWIEVEGASPKIVHPEVFESVRKILDDPERRRKGRKVYDYGLSGRVKCIKCGKAMVGQTLQKRYRYYRCRRAFAGPRHDRCPTFYVRADSLERAVKDEAAKVLANPELILAEANRLNSNGGHQAASETLTKEVGALENQKLRLLRLYQLGEVDEVYLQAESQVIQSARQRVEEQLSKIPIPTALPSATELRRAVEQVGEWVRDAEGDDFELLLQALQIEVRAEKGRGELSGVIPEYASPCNHPHVRSMVIKSATPSP